ncbi:hypothetical protein PFICI_04854 [Pestalotiopsis fici W106-1]|uniref:Xylanolytic transcriptional activator regulatory domain-containing protein n=1 Tax=Pestalotiopsis fici (strain W106-1 / CGMCC3.15140) TaxID=1229662 RepID=W3XA41_PESFW|nr:uncharacterized protein PFICI_04854 [Pestalotiopsis fici W106-1]ETS82978.1 hypothetical protein PFICI_04854 [Pestalotiopsis fici W106-1]
MNYTRKKLTLLFKGHSWPVTFAGIGKDGATARGLAQLVGIQMQTVSTRSYHMTGWIEDASPAAVADRLARIEALLEQQGQQLRQMTSGSTPNSSSAVPFDYTQSSSPVFSKFSENNEIPSFPQEQAETPTFLIPKGHTNLTTTILALPQLREQLGDFPRDYFYRIEENQPLPESLRSSQTDRRAWPPLRQAVVSKLSESYFRNVHSRQPLLNLGEFHLWQSKLLKKQPIADAEAAICLLVYALGAVTTPMAASPDASDGVLGLGFFRPALALILHEYTWNFKPDLVVVQGLLLAGSYFSHLGRPLHSWRMSYLASQRFLQTIELRRSEDADGEYHEAELRVFWQCFQEDCNRAEDLDVIRSGIEPLGDKMPLPHSMDPSDHEETIHLFAEIAIRRLLNRVHSSLYNPESENHFPGMVDPAISKQGLSLQQLLTLSSELDRQLEEWYVSIPDVIRPPRGVEPILNERGRILRIRYYAARHIIHQPFVLYAAAQQSRATSMSSAQTSPGRAAPAPPPSHSPPPTDGLLPQVVVEKCEACIESCVTFLYNMIEQLDQRSCCLWSASQSCLACFLVLLLAESCPQLQHFVPPMRGLQKAAIGKLGKWAIESSSFEAVVAIMKKLVFREVRSM